MVTFHLGLAVQIPGAQRQLIEFDGMLVSDHSRFAEDIKENGMGALEKYWSDELLDRPYA